MKYVRNNGRLLEIYDLGEPLVVVQARDGGPPIKWAGGVFEDDDARVRLRAILDSGLYDRKI